MKRDLNFMPAWSAPSFHIRTPGAMKRSLDASVVVLPLFALGFVLARFAAPAFLLLPACTFRAALGLPCPSCGMTRAGLALAQGELFQAFTYQPLFVIGIGILSVWSAGQWLEIFGQKNWVAFLINFVQKKLLRLNNDTGTLRKYNLIANKNDWLRWLTISAIAINWLYLIISN